MLESKIKEKCWEKEFETSIYESWKEQDTFHFNMRTKKRIYSIDTPPPYVNMPIHIGHAATYTLMDMFARFRRMIGYEVLFPLGLDRNGLPIEIAAERKFNVNFSKLSRSQIIDYCKKLLEESSTASVDSFLRLGISFSSWNFGKKTGNAYYTDSEDYRKLTQETFIELWEKGLIYEDERICNYCPGCKTTIADAEIVYDDINSTFNEITFKVKETNEKITIGTTRPELLGTCSMIIYNPEDERYKPLEGKTAITPIYNKEVPIRAHPQAKLEKGTGLVMMCSMGDLADIRFFREMKLDPIIAIEQDGTMNVHAGFLKGLAVPDARKNIIEELRGKGLLVKQYSLTHRTPVCERSKDNIEFIKMKEFYLKQIEFKDDLKKIASKLNFYAPQSRSILLDWIESVSTDWPISRRRYYATEIPLWYCKDCGAPLVPPKGEYYQPWKENPPFKECKKCGSKIFIGETRVFDTWFDSSLSPLYVLQYNRNEDFFKRAVPCSLRPQGKEIIRTWLYYTLLRSYLLIGNPIFDDVWINYHIVDDTGYKMSKSKGNVVDPRIILDKFGAEPFRLWVALEGNITEGDLRCSLDRIEGCGKTIVKLWNIARFISSFEGGRKIKLTDLDIWVVNEVNQLINYSMERYSKYDFHNPAVAIRHFLWEIFASHYLELVKNRVYNEQKIFSKEEQDSALWTIHYCLDRMLRLLSPIVPFITYKIYKEIYAHDIHKLQFPKPVKIPVPQLATNDVVVLNSLIWKTKRDKNLSLKAPLTKLVLPMKYKSYVKDILCTHHVDTVVLGNNLEVII